MYKNHNDFVSRNAAYTSSFWKPEKFDLTRTFLFFFLLCSFFPGIRRTHFVFLTNSHALTGVYSEKNGVHILAFRLRQSDFILRFLFSPCHVCSAKIGTVKNFFCSVCRRCVHMKWISNDLRGAHFDFCVYSVLDYCLWTTYVFYLSSIILAKKVANNLKHKNCFVKMHKPYCYLKKRWIIYNIISTQNCQWEVEIIIILWENYI